MTAEVGQRRRSGRGPAGRDGPKTPPPGRKPRQHHVPAVLKVQDLQSIKWHQSHLKTKQAANSLVSHANSLSDDKRTGESAKSQRGLFPQKLLRNKLRIAVGNGIKFQVGKFDENLPGFLPIPPARPLPL